MATDCAALISTLLQLDAVVGVYQPHCELVVSVDTSVGIVPTVPFAVPLVVVLVAGTSLRIGMRDELVACACTLAALATRSRAAGVMEVFMLFPSVAAVATQPATAAALSTWCNRRAAKV